MKTNDVTILGGGLAGLCLALQLKQRDASIKIAVVEKGTFPMPEAAHKVGESTVELATKYFEDVLQLKGHLKEKQLPKLGLRFFFGEGPIETRLELGATEFPPTPSYQLDRGRFENYLAERCQELGIEVVDGARVRDVQLSEGDEPHTVCFTRSKAKETRTSSWVVDASGRASILKRKLELEKKSEHTASAIWFRTKSKINIDTWSDSDAWRNGHDGNLSRWYSTVHLMGKGYWVWLIPISSGSTSVGIVFDESIHEASGLNTIDKAVSWLERHEPQCAEKIKENVSHLQDFRVLRNYSTDCTQVFSADKWCITGEAGVFLDPFYSPGSDFIAISNTFITRLILDERNGKPIGTNAIFFNDLYLSFFRNTLEIFRDQYHLFGDPQVMPVKIIWDFAVYWAFMAYLFFQDRLCDLHTFAMIREYLERIGKVNSYMQSYFRSWHEQNGDVDLQGKVDVFSVDYLYELNAELQKEQAGTSFVESLSANTERLEQMAAEIVSQVELSKGNPPSDSPYRDIRSGKQLSTLFSQLGV